MKRPHLGIGHEQSLHEPTSAHGSGLDSVVRGPVPRPQPRRRHVRCGAGPGEAEIGHISDGHHSREFPTPSKKRKEAEVKATGT